MATTSLTVDGGIQLASVRCCSNGSLELMATVDNGARLFVGCSRCRVIYPLERVSALLDRDGNAQPEHGANGRPVVQARPGPASAASRRDDAA